MSVAGDAPVLARCRNAPPAIRAQTDIHRRNYDFEFVELESESGDSVFQIVPKKRTRYLLKGKIWIDTESCGIRRIEGEPTVSPSFWVRRTSFRHDYAQFGEAWLPVRHHTESQLLLFGRSTLDIEYRGYSFHTGTSSLLARGTPP